MITVDIYLWDRELALHASCWWMSIPFAPLSPFFTTCFDFASSFGMIFLTFVLVLFVSDLRQVIYRQPHVLFRLICCVLSNYSEWFQFSSRCCWGWGWGWELRIGFFSFVWNHCCYYGFKLNGTMLPRGWASFSQVGGFEKKEKELAA